MSAIVKQSLVMIRANLSSLPRRAISAASMIVSVALVVCALAGFLAMAAGFEQALRSAGSPRVAVILGGGSNQENASEIPAAISRSLAALRDDIGVMRNQEGELILSREIVVPVELPAGPSGAARTLALRGMDRQGFAIRDGVSLTAGRLARAGALEIVVGERLAAQYPQFGLGRKIRLGPIEWTVAGHFAANGSAFESEIWADLAAVQAVFNRQGEVQSLRLRLATPDDAVAMAKLRARLADMTATPVIVVTEAQLYADQSAATSRLIRLFGWPLALLMACGSVAGALNTMMSLVASRAVEIATLRSLGFRPSATFLAIWFEAILLAALGCVLGLFGAWLLFNGWQASTLAAGNTSIAFQLTVTLPVVLTAASLGLAIGVIGGALPAVRASRTPLMAALRSRA